MMGTPGPNCSNTPQGPIVSGSNKALPGDPHTPSVPIYIFAQTDGQVTNLLEDSSVDNGGVVFVAINGVDNKSGVFLSSGGQFTKVLATGDAFEGLSFPDAMSLNVSIWPEGNSNGVIAFGFGRAVVVASPTGAS